VIDSNCCYTYFIQQKQTQNQLVFCDWAKSKINQMTVRVNIRSFSIYHIETQFVFFLPNKFFFINMSCSDSKILLISPSFSGSQFLLNPKSHSQPHLKSRQFHSSSIKSDSYPSPVYFEHKSKAQKTMCCSYIH